MDKEDLKVGQPVFVTAGTRRDTYEGVVKKIARKYVTIEYRLGTGNTHSLEFDIVTQKERSSDWSWAGRFQTVEQKDRDDRVLAAETGLREIGLDYSNHKNRGPRPSLEQVEAIIKLVKEWPG